MYRVLMSFALINATLGMPLYLTEVSSQLSNSFISYPLLSYTAIPGCSETQQGRRTYVAWTCHILRLVQ